MMSELKPESECFQTVAIHYDVDANPSNTDHITSTEEETIKSKHYFDTRVIPALVSVLLCHAIFDLILIIISIIYHATCTYSSVLSSTATFDYISGICGITAKILFYIVKRSKAWNLHLLLVATTLVFAHVTFLIIGADNIFTAWRYTYDKHGLFQTNFEFDGNCYTTLLYYIYYYTIISLCLLLVVLGLLAFRCLLEIYQQCQSCIRRNRYTPVTAAASVHQNASKSPI